MKEQVTIFENAQFGQIRTSINANDEPLFCLVDVCSALELKNPRQVKTRLNQRGVITTDTPTCNQHGALVMQSMTFITEPNLYKCIFQSRKKEAEQFQDWIVEEVLPSIRKSGGYIATQPNETPEQIMAKALKIADDTIKRIEQQNTLLIQQNHPKQNKSQPTPRKYCLPMLLLLPTIVFWLANSQLS